MIIPIAVDTAAPRITKWGFHGAIAHHADAAWPLAMAAIADVMGCEPDEARAFLYSRHGRHFADDVANGLSGRLSLAAAATLWMG